MVISRFEVLKSLELKKVAAVVGAILAYLEEEEKGIKSKEAIQRYVKRKNLSWKRLALQEQCFEFSLRR